MAELVRRGVISEEEALTHPRRNEILRLVEHEQRVAALPGVSEADVQIAFDPPWDQSRMTEAARLQLGLM